jgi:hypothetical protein
MSAENLSAPASRHVGHGVGEAHGRASSSPCRRSSFSPACHRPRRHHHPHRSCCSLSASQATPHTPQDAPSTLFPKPPASGAPRRPTPRSPQPFRKQPPHAFRITHELRYCASATGMRRPRSAPPQPSRYAAITTPPSGFRGPTAGAVTETRRQLPLAL